MKVPGRRDVEEIINVKNIFLSVKIVVNFWAVERIVRLSLLCPAGVLVLSYQKNVISFMTLLRTVSRSRCAETGCELVVSYHNIFQFERNEAQDIGLSASTMDIRRSTQWPADPCIRTQCWRCCHLIWTVLGLTAINCI